MILCAASLIDHILVSGERSVSPGQQKKYMISILFVISIAFLSVSFCLLFWGVVLARSTAGHCGVVLRESLGKAQVTQDLRLTFNTSFGRLTRQKYGWRAKSKH